MKKKIFALLMALCMVLGMSNVTATAAITDAEGTMEDPKYIVYQGEKLTGTVEAGASYFYTFGTGLIGWEVEIATEDALTVQTGKVTYVDLDNSSTVVEVNEYNAGGAGFIVITNYAETDAVFTVDLYTGEGEDSNEPTGGMDDPFVLEGNVYMEGALDADNSEGVWYTFEAPFSGLLEINITTDTDDLLADVEIQIPSASIYRNVSEDGTLGTGYVYNWDTGEVEEVALGTVRVPVVAGETINFCVHQLMQGEGTDAYIPDVESYTVDGTILGSIEAPIYFEDYMEGGLAPIRNGETYYFSTYYPEELKSVTIKGTAGYVYDAVADKEYEFENGSVTFVPEIETIVYSEYYSYSYIDVQIVNDVEEAGITEYEFTSVFEEGLDFNPAEMKEENSCEIEEDDMPYYYTWTAPSDGEVTFAISSTENWFYALNCEEQELDAFFYSDGSEDHDYDLPEEEQVYVPNPTVTYNVSKGDTFIYYVNSSYDEELGYAPACTITTTVAFVPGTTMDEEAVEDTVADIEAAVTEGETAGEVVLEWYDEETGDATTTVLPGEVLEAAKENNVVLEVLMGLYGWVIDPTTIADDATSVSLEVLLDTENIETTLIDEVANKNEYAQFSLVHDGPFDFTANLILPVPAEFAGKNVVLYWDNNGTLVKMGECKVDAEAGDEIGTVVFEFEHASDYVMVVEGTAPVPDTGDNTNFALWFAVLALGVAAIAGSVVMKKREF
ncbi:MAG: hypothetical protein IJ455_03300 [Agathobacter sp.]|nr:hypothetical protein [Agathobacter sp.]